MMCRYITVLLTAAVIGIQIMLAPVSASAATNLNAMTPGVASDLDGECLESAEYPGTCKLWEEGYGKAVPAACTGDCVFEAIAGQGRCKVTGKGCGCTNPCKCTTNQKTLVIGAECGGPEL